MFDCRGMDGKIRARCFSRRFFHMQGTIREWTEEKLEGGSSQILETSDLRAVSYDKTFFYLICLLFSTGDRMETSQKEPFDQIF